MRPEVSVPVVGGRRQTAIGVYTNLSISTNLLEGSVGGHVKDTPEKQWKELATKLICVQGDGLCFQPSALPNGPRLSCGALKKKVSFNILRAPAASSAC